LIIAFLCIVHTNIVRLFKRKKASSSFTKNKVELLYPSVTACNNI
jgi:hypothetical protein